MIILASSPVPSKSSFKTKKRASGISLTRDARHDLDFDFHSTFHKTFQSFKSSGVFIFWQVFFFPALSSLECPMDFSATESSSSVSRPVSSGGAAGELKPDIRRAEAPARREEGEGGANAEQHHKKKKKNKDKNKKKKRKEEQVSFY